jgi:hypothetical protein
LLSVVVGGCVVVLLRNIEMDGKRQTQRHVNTILNALKNYANSFQTFNTKIVK